MEGVDGDSGATPEFFVRSEDEETTTGSSTQEGEGEPRVEVTEEAMEEQDSPKGIISLQRDLTTLVTNIQTAADAKALVDRTKLEEARRIRREQLENDAKSSQEKFEEITKMWSIINEKVIPQELREALNSQQQLCTALIEDKRKLIHDLQQELKVRDDCYVKNLKKNAKDLDLMTERMEDQIKVLTKAYREELAETERFHMQETEVSLTEDKTKWEQHMKELWDKEQKRLTERRKKVEEYEVKLQPVMLESSRNHNAELTEYTARVQSLEKQYQQLKGVNTVFTIKKERQLEDKLQYNSPTAPIRNWILSKDKEIIKIKKEFAKQEKKYTEQTCFLSEEYKHSVQIYERLQKQFKHFTVTDARRFKEMWLMLEAEVKQLVEKALTIDSLICKQHLGVPWKRPPMAFMEMSGPIQPQKQAPRLSETGKALQHSQGMMDASVGPNLETDSESTHMEMYKEGTAVQSESGAEMEEGALPMETVREVMELLCNEAGFLIEDRIQKMLDPLGKEKQTAVKLSYVLSCFGIEEEDIPKLADFLLKSKQQQSERTEDVCAESMAEAVGTSAATETTSKHSHLNHILPALKSFLEQHKRFKERSAHQRSSLWRILKARDSSEDEAFWESAGSVISEDKVKLWDAAEIMLKQYHAVLTDISELVPETERLRKRNGELRTLLQQSCSSTVGGSHNT